MSELAIWKQALWRNKWRLTFWLTAIFVIGFLLFPSFYPDWSHDLFGFLGDVLAELDAEDILEILFGVLLAILDE